MGMTFVALADADLDLMETRIRDMDRFEFDVMSGGKTVRACLDHLKANSRRSRAAYLDGQIVAVYGVLAKTALTPVGNPWLAATDMIDRSDVRREFVRHTMDQMRWAADGFTSLWNLVSSKNTISIRWLKWIGFDFDGPSYDIHGHRFLEFRMGE